MEFDFNKIGQKKVRNFVTKMGTSDLSGLGKMQPLCYNPEVEETYKKHVETFIIKQHIEIVWKTYTTIHPNEAWNGEMVSFGLQYCGKKNAVNYLNDPYSGMEIGQVIVLNLRLFWGLLNIAVAHKIAEVNAIEKAIKLCYMEGGASEGSQWISLRETPDGFTEVSHLTRYKSKSNFRDNKLYPGLHSKAINEFHVNVKRKAELHKR